MNTKVTVAMLLVAGLGTAASVGAATSTTATTATATHHHHAMMFRGDGFMAALHKLNLTSEQQQTIHTLMASARQQMKPAGANGSADFFALQNPGDPNYAQAVHNAESAATSRIEKRSELDQQIYNLLTPEQKTQLPQVLSDMKTKLEQRRSEWQQQHSQTSSTSSN